MMKKLLAVLLIAVFASSAFAAKPAPKKPSIKKHQKFTGSKIADNKPTKPVKRK
jgi:hypothetical protein